MRCIECGRGRFRRVTDRLQRTIAGRTFSADVPATECVSCGERYFRGPDLLRREEAIARDLIAHGPPAGEALSFIRSAAGIRTTEIARLLDVTPETVFRWKHRRPPVDRALWLTVGSLALDKLAGRTDTADRLKALEKRPRKHVRINLRATGSSAYRSRSRPTSAKVQRH